MNELKMMAAAFKSRTAWEISDGYLIDTDRSPVGDLVLNLIERFYTTDPLATHCDSDIIMSQVEREIPNTQHQDHVRTYLASLEALDISSLNVAKELLSIKANRLGMRIAAKLSSGKDHSDLHELMQEYVEIGSRKYQNETEEEFNAVTATELTTKHYKSENLIHLWPNQLNEHIDGGVRGGHHILIFAPTEMGKTLFAINLCAGFVKQGLTVLYVGNEDPAADIMMRMINRLTGMNKYEVQKDPSAADAILAKRNWDKFIFANLSPGTFPKISGLVKKHRARVLILDQLRNIDVDSDNRTQALEKAATLARGLAKRFDIPVISIAQAGDSASGKLILNRGDVDSSNVGIPGQTDLMIGIGANADMEERNLRVLSFPKNKLSGRHSHLNVSIDPLLSKVN